MFIWREFYWVDKGICQVQKKNVICVKKKFFFFRVKIALKKKESSVKRKDVKQILGFKRN